MLSVLLLGKRDVYMYIQRCCFYDTPPLLPVKLRFSSLPLTMAFV
jgi:hypothetical protein